MLLRCIDNHQSTTDTRHVIRDNALAQGSVILHAHTTAVSVGDTDAKGLTLIDIAMLDRSATVHIYAAATP